MTFVVTQYGSPSLRQQCKYVYEITDHIRHVSLIMINTLNQYHALGLAANQCDLDIQMCVIRVGSTPMVVLNPRLHLCGKTIRSVEGCLSLPDINVEIERSDYVKMDFLSLEGNHVQGFELWDLDARVAQHEVDHLNGVLMIDRLTQSSAVSLSQRILRDLATSQMPPYAFQRGPDAPPH